jgi:ribosomal protein S18 acetylase RimI-like enzyme
MGIKTAEVDVRLATRRDLEQIMEIELLAYDRPWQPVTVELAVNPQSVLGRKMHPLVACEIGRPASVLGTAFWAWHQPPRGTKASQYGHVYGVAVHPSCWRRGVGEALAAACIAGMVRQKLSSATAACAERHLGGQQMLKGLGFDCVRTRDRYAEPKSDWLSLQDGHVPEDDRVLWFARCLR